MRVIIFSASGDYHAEAVRWSHIREIILRRIAVCIRKIVFLYGLIVMQPQALLAFEQTGFSARRCEYDLDSFLKQNFQSFDQSENGWRKISEITGCEEAGADLINKYRMYHGLSIDKFELSNENRPHSEAATLYFHEAQLRAEIGHNSLAINYFRLSMHESFGDWNLYVKATIAFLEKDKKLLKKLRSQLANLPLPKDFGYIELDGTRKTGRPDWWPANLKILDSFLRCFDKSYAEAYGDKKCRIDG